MKKSRLEDVRTKNQDDFVWDLNARLSNQNLNLVF